MYRDLFNSGKDAMGFTIISIIQFNGQRSRHAKDFTFFLDLIVHIVDVDGVIRSYVHD